MSGSPIGVKFGRSDYVDSANNPNRIMGGAYDGNPSVPIVPGFQIIYRVATPTLFKNTNVSPSLGSFFYLQTASRRFQKWASFTSTPVKSPYFNERRLDTGCPYTPTNENFWECDAGTPMTSRHTQDLPWIVRGASVELDVNDAYDMYVMYKPPLKSSSLGVSAVPVDMFPWTWIAHGKKSTNSSIWSPKIPGDVKTSTATPYPAFPVWESYVNQYSQ
jgi:hypothetical protein